MYFGNRAVQSSTSDAACSTSSTCSSRRSSSCTWASPRAMAWLLFVIILAITIIQVRVGNRFVYYKGD
jgi:multiple sugar transport system permease protein